MTGYSVFLNEERETKVRIKSMMMVGFLWVNVLLRAETRGGKLGEFSAQNQDSAVVFTEMKVSFFLAFLPISLPLVSNHERC